MSVRESIELPQCLVRKKSPPLSCSGPIANSIGHSMPRGDIQPGSLTTPIIAQHFEKCNEYCSHLISSNRAAAAFLR
jgi:hypothetical protein